MIPSYLIEAYAGHYDLCMGFSNQIPSENLVKIENLIQADTPKRRLEIYLEWNGILGWTEQICSILNTKRYTI